MTIAISLKVNDGLVLAADSASTLMSNEPAGSPGVINVYNNANKVFNLLKGTPIGAITWGSGSIGSASISTLAKDLRRRFSGKAPEQKDWEISPTSYSVLEVARRLRRFMFEENYVNAFKDWKTKPDLGFIVSGYSSGEMMAEEYQIDIAKGECAEPRLLREKSDCGLTCGGQPEAISRLMSGFSPLLSTVLEKNMGVPRDQVAPALDVLRQNLGVPLVMPAMPMQDAIDLAEFLVDLTIRFSRFMPGAPTVGGPIEVAAISKHEGFKWVRRKHYYGTELNPES